MRLPGANKRVLGEKKKLIPTFVRRESRHVAATATVIGPPSLRTLVGTENAVVLTYTLINTY